MIKKTLGIDIGSSYLKAVLLNRDYKGRYVIEASVILDMADEGGLEPSFRKLFTDKHFKDVNCVVSIPAGFCSFRNLSLPFSAEKMTEEIITYELEPHIPEPIETVVVSSLPISSDAESTTVLAAAAKKEDLQELLKYIPADGIDIIDIDAVSVALNMPDQDSPNRSWILLDIGAHASVAIFGRGKSVVHVRSFPWGVAAPSEAGTVQAVSKIGDRPGRKLFEQISQTRQFLMGKTLLEDPSRIYLTGGGALSGRLRENLASFFSIPIEVIDLRERKEIALPAKNRSWNAPLMNQALALALRGSEGSPGFNFHKFESAPTKKRGRAFKSELRWSALILLVLFLSVGTNLLAGYYVDSRKLTRLREEVTRSFKSACPEVTHIVDPVRQLQQKINETRSFSTGIENGSRFLDFWKKAMDSLPENSGIILTELNYNQDSMEVSGEAPDFQAINRWKSDLEKSRSFFNIQMQFGNGSGKDAKKTFKLRMSHVL